MGISGSTVRDAPDLLIRAFLSDAMVRRYAVDWEDLKSYSKSEKGHISGVGQQVYYLQVFTNFSNHRKKTNRAAVLSCRPLPTFLNAGTTDQTFQQSGIEIPSDKYWRVQLGVMNI